MLTAITQLVAIQGADILRGGISGGKVAEKIYTTYRPYVKSTQKKMKELKWSWRQPTTSIGKRHGVCGIFTNDSQLTSVG